MNVLQSLFVFRLILAYKFIVSLAVGHVCLNMELSLDTLSSGITTEQQCVIEPPVCVLDTFYEENLFLDLVNKYKNNKYLYTGTLKITDQWDEWDTSYVGDSIPVIVQYRGQELDIQLNTAFKDSYPNTNFRLRQSWVHSSLDSTTYAPMEDSTFLVFFNKADSTRDFEWTPTLDCLFEPSVYYVINGRVHKRGNGRMPGVSVDLEEFLKAAVLPVFHVSKKRINKHRGLFYGFSSRIVGKHHETLFTLDGKVIPETDLKTLDLK